MNWLGLNGKLLMASSGQSLRCRYSMAATADNLLPSQARVVICGNCIIRLLDSFLNADLSNCFLLACG